MISIAYQVSTTLGAHVDEYDIDAIASQLVADHGPIDSIDNIESGAYWRIVDSYER